MEFLCEGSKHIISNILNLKFKCHILENFTSYFLYVYINACVCHLLLFTNLLCKNIKSLKIIIILIWYDCTCSSTTPPKDRLRVSPMKIIHSIIMYVYPP